MADLLVVVVGGGGAFLLLERKRALYIQVTRVKSYLNIKRKSK